MVWGIKKLWLLFLVVLCATPVFYGCEGSDSREQINETVKEFSGQKKVEHLVRAKKDISVIQGHQEDRLKQIDESLEE